MTNNTKFLKDGSSSADYFNGYISKLKNMDWFYDYSDDFKVWNQGSRDVIELIELAKDLDKNFIHWNNYCTNDNLSNGGNA